MDEYTRKLWAAEVLAMYRRNQQFTYCMKLGAALRALADGGVGVLES